MNTTLPPILAAEDVESDRFILKLAHDRAGQPNPLVTVNDGQEAVDYLAGTGRYADRAAHPLPALVILDLKMPRMNGFDFLTWLVTRPEFKSLPVVVLTSSSDESDIKRARQLGARDYFVKPLSLPEFVQILKTLCARWLDR